MKISTKLGDTGKTDIHGKRIDKGSPTIELLGTLDECIAQMILLANQVTYQETIKNHVRLLSFISAIVAGYAKEDEFKKDFLIQLENEISKMENNINFQFNYPFDCVEAAQLNLVRTLIRKVEHTLWKYEVNNSLIICAYLNRLSDWYYLKQLETQK